MSDTVTAIPPALTSKEWASPYLYLQATVYDSERNGAAEIHADLSGPRSIVITEHPSETRVAFDDPAMLASLVALANNALPDGDPRKIVRDDVWALRDHAHRARRQERAGDAADLDAIAAKLAALLPPDE